MELGELNGESIKSAIAQKIIAAFQGTGFTPKIYKEKIIEGMTKPCFFIWTMDTQIEKQMRDNYLFTYMMNIRYHADEDQSNLYEHLSAIGLRAVEYLRKIEISTIDWDNVNQERKESIKSITGKQVSYQIVEGILQIYVTYSLKVFIPESVDKMNTLVEDVKLL